MFKSFFSFSEKLPCVDRITYCDEFDERVCTEERYGEYMRENCRRTCNLCQGIFKITFPNKINQQMSKMKNQ